MDLFDIGLNTKGLKGKRSKFTGNLLYDYDYGRDLSPENDFYSMVNSYRGWSYICSGRNATAVAKTPLRLYVAKERKSQKIKTFPTKEVSIEVKKYLYKNPSLIQKASFRKSEDIEEITDHPFLDLINTVNGFMNRFTLFEFSQLYQELTGNSYWYIIPNKMGIPQEIWPMPPQNMRIIPDKKVFIKGYEYQRGNSGINFLYGSGSLDSIFYKEKEVVHFKMPSPTNMFYGRGPLSACFDEYLLGQEMNRYENAVFKNNGRLDGAFETAQELGDYEFERLKAEIKSSFYGTKNAGKSPLLDNGVTFKPYSYAPKDMAYDKGRNKIKEIITNCFGQSLGLYDREANRNNADVAVNQFLESTIVPRLIRMEEKLNEKVLPMYDSKLFCSFDDPVPENFDRKLKEREQNLRTGYTTVNLERKKDGLSPLPNEASEVPFMAVNMAPADGILENFRNIDVEETNKKIDILNGMNEYFEERIARYEIDGE